MNDSEIVEGLFAREEAALEALRARYGGRCMALAGRVLADSRDAEECVSDAMLAVWQNVPPDRPRSLGAYVGKITRNLAFNRLDYNRAKKRGAALCALVEELAECLPDRAPVEERVEARETLEIIDRFLEREGEEARKAFLLRYWHCFSLPEVAKRLGRTQSSTKSLLFRLRRRLKVELERGERRI